MKSGVAAAGFIAGVSVLAALLAGRVSNVGDDPLFLHRTIAKSWMCWGDSTTPIPISYAAKLTKYVLSGDLNELPEGLKDWVAKEGYDTVSIQVAWDFIREQRLKEIQELCSGDNWDRCHEAVNFADPRFKLTPLHLAKYSRDEKLANMLLAMGADPSLEDIAGRKPVNMTFANFVENSRKFAERDGRECQIPEVYADKEGEWKAEVRRLVSEGEPVIIRNVVKGPPITLDELTEKFGDSVVRVGAVPYADYFGMNIEHLTLGQFIEQSVRGDDGGSLPLYVFAKDALIAKEWFETMRGIVSESFPVPEIFADPSKIGPDALHFALGREGSGAPIHIHSDALNLVLAGSKRWFVLPPQDAIYSRKHISDWVKEDLDSTALKPLECVQHSGDAIYVPFDWAHGVINGGQYTFAFALELLSERDSLKVFK